MIKQTQITILIGCLVAEQGQFWQDLLLSQGYKVNLVSAETNMVKTIKELHSLPHLIMVDMGLKNPNTNVLQSSAVCRWCKENHPALKVVLISPEEQIRDLENRWALRQGAIALFPKLSELNLANTIAQIAKILGTQVLSSPLPDLIITQKADIASNLDLKANDQTLSAPVGELSATEFYLNQAISLINEGNLEAAKAELNTCLSFDANYVPAYLWRGYVYLSLDKFQRALDDYNQVIKLDPKNAEVFWRRGNMYDKLGENQLAIADFDQAIKLNSQLGEAYCGRGLIKFRSGDERQAAKDYDKAIQVNPQYAESYNNRGILRCALGNLPAALQDFDQAIKLNPQYTDAYYNRGNIYADTGKWTQAIADYTEAIRLNPNFAIAYGNRGIAYYEIDKIEAAIADTQTAANIFNDQGDTSSYRQALETIKQMR